MACRAGTGASRMTIRSSGLSGFIRGMRGMRGMGVPPMSVASEVKCITICRGKPRFSSLCTTNMGETRETPMPRRGMHRGHPLRQSVPPARSSRVTPISVNPLRIESASAKFLLARASCRRRMMSCINRSGRSSVSFDDAGTRSVRKSPRSCPSWRSVPSPAVAIATD